MKKSKMVQGKWEKVKKHPLKTYENTPQFCASDFAFTVEQTELFLNWRYYKTRMDFILMKVYPEIKNRRKL